MTALLRAIPILGALVFIVALVRLIRLPLSRRAKTGLLLLRLALLTLLVLAFVEPSFRIRRLQNEPLPVPVLLDVSRSMSLFGAEPTPAEVAPCVLPPGGPDIPLVVFCFGDSLRRCDNAADLSFADKRSRFPVNPGHKALRKARGVLIVSDGNWERIAPARGLLREKEARYLVLPPFRPSPTIRIAPVSVPRYSLLDSSATARIELSGYVSAADTLHLYSRGRGRSFSARELPLDSGSFGDTLSVALASAPTGRHLQRISAVNRDSTVSAHLRLIHNVVPGTMTYALHTPAPTLDRRFISLSLSTNPRWEKLPTATEAPRALFVFSWDSTAARLVERLPRSSLVVFVGCLPSSRVTHLSPRTFSTFAPEPAAASLEPLRTAELPPPRSLLRYAPEVFRQKEILLSAAATSRKDSSTIDTLPLLWKGRYRGHPGIALAATGIWRWDFRPLSLRNNRQPFAFSHALLALVEEYVLKLALQEFYVFPAEPEITESDSLRLEWFLPATATGDRPLTGRFELRSEQGDTLVDTVVTFAATMFDQQTVSLPPQRQGNYAYAATLDMPEGTVRYEDSLHVSVDMSEYRISGQNTLLLGQIARPLECDDSAAFNDFLLGSIRNAPETVTTTLRISQNWYLLGLILLVLSLEWVLRRKLSLD